MSTMSVSVSQRQELQQSTIQSRTRNKVQDAPRMVQNPDANTVSSLRSMVWRACMKCCAVQVDVYPDRMDVQAFRNRLIEQNFGSLVHGDLSVIHLRRLLEIVKNTPQYHAFKVMQMESRAKKYSGTSKQVPSSANMYQSAFTAAFMRLAIVCMDMSRLEFTITPPPVVTVLGDFRQSPPERVSGERLRFHYRRLFEKGVLTAPMAKALYEGYINRKVNEMLTQIPTDHPNDHVRGDRRDIESISNWNAVRIDALQNETKKYLLLRANKILKELSYATK